jgi:Reverse transcriptase (RNA-dependent DNA polymerase)
VFDVKHDGRHKARLVADGHLTDIPLDSVYSGVVSLRGFRLVLFLAELSNNLQLWATNIGNAYLEAYTTEKVYIIAGPEFGEREGHILEISKALYGLCSSGARWHDRFADCIRELSFFPCKAEPDIWMRKNGYIYKYIAVYVDDLAIAMTNPKEFTDILETRHKFNLKGTGPITFHLGMDFTRDDDNTLCISPTK